jgi:hypothetical protein
MISKSAVIAVIVLLLSGCGDAKKAFDEAFDKSYVDGWKTSFVESCTGGNNQKAAFCQCIAEKSVANLSSDQLKNVEVIKAKIAPQCADDKKAVGTAHDKAFIENWKASFVASCVGGNSQKTNFCNCMADKSVVTLSVAELNNIEVIKEKILPQCGDVTRNVSTAHDKAFIQNWKANFVESCVGGNSQKTLVCNCIAEKSVSNLPVEQLDNIQVLTERILPMCT